MKKMIATRLKQQEGATAVEYGLIAGLIAVAIVVTLLAIGPKLNGVFSSVENSLPTTTAAP